MSARLAMTGLLVPLLACTDSQAPQPTPEPQLRDVILFLSDRNGGRQMHLISPDGGPVEPLFPDTNVLGGGTIAGRSAISPDGHWVAFSMLGDIWVARADGTEPRNLTDLPGADSYPAWSPDGTRIAFQSDRDGDEDIYVMDVDGTHLAQITNDPGQDAVPAWSPDGSEIAFKSNRTGTADIFVVPSVGGVPVQLTSGPDWDGEPAWSADGATIVFDRSGSIYLMDANGGNIRPLVEWAGIGVSFPAWGSGDSLIVFAGEGDLWLVRPDGSGVTNVTNEGLTFLDGTPAWAH